MKEALKTAMTTSISEVLETMFFMTIDISDDAELSSFVTTTTTNNLTVSNITFSGPLSGNFQLMIPENILKGMTQTFMSVTEEDVTETHLSGTASEAINMVAGNTFSILDDQAVFDLGIPEILETGSLPDQETAPGTENIFLGIETPDGNIGLYAVYSV